MRARTRFPVLTAAAAAIAAVALLLLREGVVPGPPPGEVGTGRRGEPAPGRSYPAPTRAAPAAVEDPDCVPESPPAHPGRPGFLQVRLRDRGSGRWIREPQGMVLSWTWGDPALAGVERAWAFAYAPSPSWVQLELGSRMPRRDFRLLVPGYLPEPVTLDAPPPDGILPLSPDPRSVHGTLVAPPGEGWEVGLAVVDRRDGTEVWPDPLSGVALPSVRTWAQLPGPFVLSIDPPGRYFLRVRWTRSLSPGEETWWATRECEVGGGGADLGSIEPVRGVDLRARLLAGVPATPARGPGLRVVVHRGGGAAEEVGYGEYRTRPSPTAWPGGGAASWENAAPEGVEDGGWWRWSGFQPGSEVVLLAPSFPGVWKRVRLPAEPGAVATAELDARDPTADCVFHFSIDGRQPDDWGRVLAGPCYDEDFKSGIGVLEAAIPLGRHRIVVEATMDVEEGGTGQYEVDFEVRSTGRWETTFDLVPVRR